MRVAASVFLAVVSSLPAQTAFDVASVKPSGAGFRGIVTGEDGSFRAGGATLEELVSSAYGVPEYRIEGATGWMRSERWEIDARAAATQNVSAPVFQALLRGLLEDRFKLRAIKEDRDGNVYYLDLGKSGVKMQPSVDSARPQIGVGNGMIASNRMTGDLLAATLGRVLRRPVIDRTGLTAAYEVHMSWTPEAGEGDPLLSAAPPPPPGVVLERRSIFSAIEEDLGLKLTSGRQPAPMVTILSAERPDAN